MKTETTSISRVTFDGIRFEVDGGIVYRGLYAVNRKPLAPSEVALVVGCVALCDSSELLDLVKFARTLSTPGEIFKALEDKRNPPPKPKRLPRRGKFRSSRLNPITGVITMERW